jgi:folate-dependent phosphoribosylglycinamide formyltransferase PurN
MLPALFDGRICTIGPVEMSKKLSKNGKFRLSPEYINLVVPEVDAGAIVMQAAVPVLADDTVASLQARIHAEEYVIYPQAIALCGASASLSHR